jgi:ribonuclease HII
MAKVFEQIKKFDEKYPSPLAGVDEAGRGPWAGPVVAAAVVLDPSKLEALIDLNDSKKIPEKKREELFDIVMNSSLSYAIAEASHEVIDNTNILAATLDSMKNALEKLAVKPVFVIIDGNKAPEAEGFKMEAVIDGDAKSLSIAAASILAKVHRDRIMRNYAKMYPQYGFDSHKGYGTKAHVEALRKHGVCPIHRQSYKPVKEFINNK